MSLGSASKELLNVGGGLPAKLVGGAVIGAIVKAVRPFEVIENNELGFRRRVGKVKRAPHPTPENASRFVKVLRSVKPKSNIKGHPIPKILTPGLHLSWPLTHSIKKVSTQSKSMDLGTVQAERGYKKVYDEKAKTWVMEHPPKLTQHNLHAEIDWRVNPDGFNPYRAIDEVDDREAAVKRICRGAIGKAALSIDNIRVADADLLTSVVQYHSYEQLLKIGCELLHVTGISDTRTFGEMVQTREGAANAPAYILADENGPVEATEPTMRPGLHLLHGSDPA